MVQLSRRTIEDFVGNVADDAKQALDEVLERGGGREGEAPPGGAAGVAGGAGGVGGVADIAQLARAVESLAALPAQVGELSRLVSTLLATLEASSDPVGAVGRAAGGKKGG